MKIKKNKIVFVSVLAVILLFLTSYSIMLMGGGGGENGDLKETSVPKLEGDQKEYGSKLDAINDLKEVRETNAPSIYDEKLIDSLGFYDPDLPERQKEHVVDSIYSSRGYSYTEGAYQNTDTQKIKAVAEPKTDRAEFKREKKVQAKEMGLEHQLFFASAPAQKEASAINDSTIYAVVDGDQVVKAHSRLQMRLTGAITLNGERIPKNTPVYGFVGFAPNRVLIGVKNIDHHPLKLKAYDLQDGSEGIYVENNFRAEAKNELLNGIVEDINIPSVPQVSGLTRIFQRNNRNVKVTVLNNYKLILRPKL